MVLTEIINAVLTCSSMSDTHSIEEINNALLDELKKSYPNSINVECNFVTTNGGKVPLSVIIQRMSQAIKEKENLGLAMFEILDS